MILPLLDRWAARSQQGARRNAMLATTELTQRRVEHDEVEAFLAHVRARRTTALPVSVAAVATR